MNIRTTAHPARVVLLDIEGTTTPIDFVYDVLFPYARERMSEFMSTHAADADVREAIDQLVEENTRDLERGLAPPIETQGGARLESIVAYALWLMDQDRKSTPLKTLQGRIWELGYQSGKLRSHLFDDVPRAFTRWRDEGRDICIYSSGSVLAQKLLFAHTEAGDLTVHIRDYFDTRVGAKREAASYGHIATWLGREPSDIVFISDVVAELDAAREAGLRTRLCVRPGNPPQPPSSHQAIRSFDEADG